MLSDKIKSRLIWIFISFGIIFALASFLRIHIEWLADLCGVVTGAGCSHADQYELFGFSLSLWGLGFYVSAALLHRFARKWLFYLVMIGAGVEIALIDIMVSGNFTCFFCLLNAIVIVGLIILHIEYKKLWQSVSIALIIYFMMNFLLAKENPYLTMLAKEYTGKEVIAEVNGSKITLTDLESEIASQLNEMHESIYHLKRNRLEELIKLSMSSKFSSGAVPDNEQLSSDARRILVKLQRDNPVVNKYLERPSSPFSQVPAGNSPGIGPEDAKVTVIEFLDYRCPMCKISYSAVKELQKFYPKDIRWVFKIFPLKAHKGSYELAEAVLCANAQGRFREFQDAIFSTRKIDPAELPQLAAKLGLDSDEFTQCLNSSRYAQEVQDTITEAGRAGISGTPSFIINGRFFSGPVSVEGLKKIIDEAMKK